MIIVAAIAACKETAPDAAGTDQTSQPVIERDLSASNTGPNPTIQARAAANQACVDQGGKPAIGGLGGRAVCIFDTKDAGQSCTASSECEGMCLATDTGGVCAPEIPYFGCYAVMENGQTPTLCVD